MILSLLFERLEISGKIELMTFVIVKKWQKSDMAQIHVVKLQWYLILQNFANFLAPPSLIILAEKAILHNTVILRREYVPCLAKILN